MQTKAAIYVRISKDTKDSETGRGVQDNENQLISLQQFAERSDYEIVQIYADECTGGSSDDRKAFRQMLADATKRKFSVLIVWALDRMTREGIHKTFDHIKVLQDNKIEFISYSEPHFRTTGPFGELAIALAAFMAKQERERLIERTNAGLARYRKQYAEGTAKSRTGKNLPIGRPHRIVNWSKVLDLKKQGKTIREIADKYSVSPMTVQRILKRYESTTTGSHN